MRHTFTVSIDIPPSLQAEYEALMERDHSDAISDELEEVVLNLISASSMTARRNLALFLIGLGNEVCDRLGGRT